MADSDVTLALLAALATQGRTPSPDTDGSLLAARATCMLVTLQHKVPAAMLASWAAGVIFPDLIHRHSKRPSVAGLYLERDGANRLNMRVVSLEGSGVGRIRDPGGLVVITPDADLGQAILAGRMLGSDISVRPGPLRHDRMPDAAGALCWFMYGSTLSPGTISGVFVRAEDGSFSPDTAALLDIISAVFRNAEARFVRAAGGFLAE